MGGGADQSDSTSEPPRLPILHGSFVADGERVDGHENDEAYLADLRAWGVLPPALVRWKWKRSEDGSKPDRLTEKALGAGGREQYLRRRRYGASGLPTMAEQRPPGEPGDKTADDVRFLLYGEVMSSWRTLTGARFRLMNLLPAVSIVGLVPLVLITGDEGLLLPAGGVVLALLGLALTHGLHIYEARNDGLYDDLISRARRIEYELGVETGIMRGRLEAHHDRVSHGRATAWVFGSVKLAWCVVAVVLAIRLATNLRG